MYTKKNILKNLFKNIYVYKKNLFENIYVHQNKNYFKISV